jgi:hypothetical protein
MSSTLFGRGVNAQVGMRRRAEQVNRELAEVKAATTEIKDVPRDIYMIKAQVASFEKTVLAHLQALEKRLDGFGNFDARIRVIEEKLAAAATATAAAAAAATAAAAAAPAAPPTITVIPMTTS